SNGLIYIQNIKDALIRLDPANKEHYEKNYEAYRQKLVETDQYIQQLIQSIPEERRVLITSHDAFQYYGRRYGIRLEAVMGISTDVDVQTSDITRLYKVIASSGVPAIFIESTINPKLLKQIAGDNNIVIGGELYADSIGDQDSPAPSYIDMLRHNTEVIAKALKMKKKRAAHSSQEKRAAQKKDSSYWWLYGTIAFIALGGLLLTAKNLSI
ncbi:MAG TPA: hypothetical protein ENJ45_06420, partial [Phaeodactylibacter sp.]|nr:hypothetical protein [Phaeodactylibacter sp.]